MEWPELKAIPPWKGVIERKSVDTLDFKQKLSISGKFVCIYTVLGESKMRKWNATAENKMGKSLF